MRLLLTATLALVPSVAWAQDAPLDDQNPAPTGAPAATDDGPAPVAGKPVHKRKAGHDRVDFRVGTWRGTVDAALELVGGALSGRTTLREDGGLIEASVEAEPALERGRWRLALPVQLAHRETPGAEQRETRAGLDVDARYRTGPALRVDLDAGLRVADRPAWLDEYQPTATGLGSTDRYSHVDLRLGAAIAAIPLRHQHVRAGLRYVRYDYADDPAYNAVDSPTHLVPGDRREVQLEASWRHFGDGWKLGGAVELEDQRDDDNYARDAGDGQTHAGAGGPPPNPLYHELSAEPSVAAELDLLGGDLELGADLGYAIASDRYQGYYSRRGLHPQIHATLSRGKLSLRATAEARFATYGDGSYQSDGSPGRPPLQSGTRRADRKLGARLAGGYRLGHRLEAIAGLDVSRRDTNFPDYVPGVFPSTRQYDVQWDYTNWELTVGVRFRR